MAKQFPTFESTLPFRLGPGISGLNIPFQYRLDFKEKFFPSASDQRSFQSITFEGQNVPPLGQTVDSVVVINQPFNNKAFKDSELILTPFPAVTDLTWGGGDPTTGTPPSWRIQDFYEKIITESEPMRQAVLAEKSLIPWQLKDDINNALADARGVWLRYLNDAYGVVDKYFDNSTKIFIEQLFVDAVRHWLRRYQELLAIAVSGIDNAEAQSAPGRGLTGGGLAGPSGTVPGGAGAGLQFVLTPPPPPEPGGEDSELLPDDQVYQAIIAAGAIYLGKMPPPGMTLQIAGQVLNQLYPQMGWPMGATQEQLDQFLSNADENTLAAFNQVQRLVSKWSSEIFSESLDFGEPIPIPPDLPPAPPPAPAPGGQATFPGTPVPPMPPAPAPGGQPAFPGTPVPPMPPAPAPGGQATFPGTPVPPGGGVGTGGASPTPTPPLPPIPTPDPEGSGGQVPEDAPRPMPPAPRPPSPGVPAPEPAPAASSNMMPLLLGAGAVAVLLLMSRKKR